MIQTSCSQHLAWNSVTRFCLSLKVNYFINLFITLIKLATVGKMIAGAIEKKKSKKKNQKQGIQSEEVF